MIYCIETGIGYKLRKEVNHLVFMNELKLFAKSESQIDSRVCMCSQDIGMEFGISKCAVISLKRGKRVECSGIPLLSGESIGNPEDDDYKYRKFFRVG